MRAYRRERVHCICRPAGRGVGGLGGWAREVHALASRSKAKFTAARHTPSISAAIPPPPRAHASPRPAAACHLSCISCKPCPAQLSYPRRAVPTVRIKRTTRDPWRILNYATGPCRNAAAETRACRSADKTNASRFCGGGAGGGAPRVDFRDYARFGMAPCIYICNMICAII